MSTDSVQRFSLTVGRRSVTGMTADLPRLVLRREALLRGLSDDEISALRRSRSWSTLQRGAYLAGEPALGARARHVLRVQATVAGLRTPAVVRHVFAAAIHGLPLWQVPLHLGHITRPPPARSDRGTRLRSHVTRLPDDDVVALAGLAVTGVARTVVDVARSLPFAPAPAIADAALRSRATTREEMQNAVAAAPGTRGESVGESRSRALMIELGLPVPDLQVEVHTSDGRFVGRTDFGSRQHRLLGEFDGRAKYGRLLRPGQSPGDAVFEEKRREDALRGEDYAVIRWVWQDLDQPVRWAEGIQRRLLRVA